MLKLIWPLKIQVSVVGTLLYTTDVTGKKGSSNIYSNSQIFNFLSVTILVDNPTRENELKTADFNELNF